jgi:WD40 repeat protein
VRPVGFLPDKKLVLLKSSNELQLWETSTGRVVRKFAQDNAGINRAALSNDGRLALTASVDQTIRLWDVNTRLLIRTFQKGMPSARELVFSPDSKLAFSSFLPVAQDAPYVILWDVATGRPRRSFRVDQHWGPPTAVSSDGRLACTGWQDIAARKQYVVIWRLADERELRRLQVEMWEAVFTRDGKNLIGHNANTLMRWDITSGTQQWASKLTGAPAFAFSAGGDWVLSAFGAELPGSEEGISIMIWNGTDGRLVNRLK